MRLVGGVYLGLWALAFLCASCETRTRGVMVPTASVSDTVSVPPCWPPGHCREGRTARVTSTVPHGYAGEFFAIRYKGAWNDTTIGLVTVEPNVTFDPGIDGAIKGQFCDLVASIYYEVTGDSIASGHGYVYAGTVELPVPGKGKSDRIFIGEDVCSGARMRWGIADDPGTYGEAIEVTLESSGETFTVPRNGDVEGRVGQWRYRASFRDVVGGAQALGLLMRWGKVSVEVAGGHLVRGTMPVARR